MLNLALTYEFQREKYTRHISIPISASATNNFKQIDHLFEVITLMAKKFIDLQCQPVYMIQVERGVIVKNILTNEISKIPMIENSSSGTDILLQKNACQTSDISIFPVKHQLNTAGALDTSQNTIEKNVQQQRLLQSALTISPLPSNYQNQQIQTIVPNYQNQQLHFI